MPDRGLGKEASMGLTLTRRDGEALKIGNEITVRVVRIGCGKVRLDIVAPPSVQILREELVGGPVPGTCRVEEIERKTA